MVVAQSTALEWPPAGPTAVQAMTDATEALATTLVAAGWKPLPLGGAWYAKRFAWEPTGAEPAEASPDHGAWRRVREVLPVALLCAVIVLAPIAAVQLRGRGDNAPAVRATPSPAKGPADTGTARAAKPKSSDGVDLTIPVLILVSVVALAVVVRQTRARDAER